MLKRFKEWREKKRLKKIREERIKQTKIDILEGKYLKLSVKDPEVAEIIAKWTCKREYPVEFFLECLSIMGINSNVEIEPVKEFEKEKEFILREKKGGKERKFFISQIAEEYLKLKEPKGEQISYYVSLKTKTYKTIPANSSIPFFKLKDEMTCIKIWSNLLKITVDNDITINIRDYTFDIDENLYINVKNLIEDLKIINGYYIPYDYYKEVKKRISKYFELKDATLEVIIMDHSSIKTRNDNLIEYKEAALGIIIKKYLDKDHKEYRFGDIEVVWKDGYIQFPESSQNLDGLKKDLQEQYEIAKEAIEKIENFKF